MGMSYSIHVFLDYYSLFSASRHLVRGSLYRASALDLPIYELDCSF